MTRNSPPRTDAAAAGNDCLAALCGARDGRSCPGPVRQSRRARADRSVQGERFATGAAAACLASGNGVDRRSSAVPTSTWLTGSCPPTMARWRHRSAALRRKYAPSSVHDVRDPGPVPGRARAAAGKVAVAYAWRSRGASSGCQPAAAANLGRVDRGQGVLALAACANAFSTLVTSLDARSLQAAMAPATSAPLYRHVDGVRTRAGARSVTQQRAVESSAGRSGVRRRPWILLMRFSGNCSRAVRAYTSLRCLSAATEFGPRRSTIAAPARLARRRRVRAVVSQVSPEATAEDRPQLQRLQQQSWPSPRCPAA